MKSRTLAKLKITIQPLVVQKEDAQFKKNWSAAIRASESNLVKCLCRHLERVISSTNKELETATTEAFYQGTVLL